MSSSKGEDTSIEALESKFKKIGLSDKSLNEAIKSKQIRASLDKVIDEAPEQVPADPSIAALLLSLATATQKGNYDLRPRVVKEILAGRIKSPKQVEGTPYSMLN